MKTLQNNFTTPEQSKRLLELGVPADSADCYINEFCNNRAFQLSDIFSKCTWLPKKKPFPCWSIGRLMEIYLICQTFGEGLHFLTADDWDENMLDELCNLFSTMAKCNYIDFSKLEE